jgi:hypothetical protein
MKKWPVNKQKKQSQSFTKSKIDKNRHERNRNFELAICPIAAGEEKTLNVI